VLADERRVFRARPHWASMVRPAATAALLILVLALLLTATSAAGGALWPVTTLLWYGQVAALGWLAYRVLHWHDDILMVTDRRILRVAGVFSSRMDYMPISKVTDGTVKQTPIGILLRYSYMRFESAGQKQSLEHINFIPHPHALYEAITKIVVGKDDLPPPRKGRRAFGHWPGTPTTGNLSNEWSE